VIFNFPQLAIKVGTQHTSTFTSSNNNHNCVGAVVKLHGEATAGISLATTVRVGGTLAALAANANAAVEFFDVGIALYPTATFELDVDTTSDCALNYQLSRGVHATLTMSEIGLSIDDYKFTVGLGGFLPFEKVCFK
jgi:hypothetical protein